MGKTTVGPTAVADYSNIRLFHNGYGVVVEVPKEGALPTAYSFVFPTPAYDILKLGGHEVRIDWGDGSTAPVISIDPVSTAAAK